MHVDLDAFVRQVMAESEKKALTVPEVTQKVAALLEPQIKKVLNSLVIEEHLNSVHGGGRYRTNYIQPPMNRRI